MTRDGPRIRQGKYGAKIETFALRIPFKKGTKSDASVWIELDAWFRRGKGQK
jgi:hypothetical protein